MKNGLAGKRAWRPLPTHVLATFFIAALIALSGCQVVFQSEPSTPTPVPYIPDTEKQTYEVQRGSIYDTIRGLGRITPAVETPLYFKRDGRLGQRLVEIGQRVDKDDLLAELDTGNLALQVEQARLNWDIAELKVRQAAGESIPSNVHIMNASAAVQSAEAAMSRALGELQRLREGPPASDRVAAAAAVTAAEASVERARNELARLTAPKSDDDIAAARAALEKATAARDRAQGEFNRVAHQVDIHSSPQATALQQATSDYDAAVAAYNLATAGPTEEDVALAKRTVEVAEGALRGANARLAQVDVGPRIEDRNAAERAVRSAEAALASARSNYDFQVAQSAGTQGSSFDLLIAQKSAELARVTYEGLIVDQEGARIRAPFDGVVTMAYGTQGESIPGFTPIVMVGDTTRLEVATEMESGDVARVKEGQEAIILLDAFPNLEIEATVARLPIGVVATSTGPLTATAPGAVLLSFEPPGPGAVVGQLAQVTIVTQQKDDVLLIPNAALRRFGTRKYVQTVGPDGRRRDIDVETGMITETETEITSGLREGTTIIVQ
ncbi:MAG TPA: HlyD family efflux transporter periplasmic adaptor subunit [Chloroflexota bacterium]|nr:HlyD family efflux transporter periplasmic adaptor subunit [Chloroflexota bacterium]